MSKKNLILSIILLALILSAWILNGPYKNWMANSGKEDNFLKNLKVDEINKIIVSQNGTDTILEKSGDKWKIGGTKDFFVRDGVSGSFVTALQNAVKADIELASNNKDKKSSFLTDVENGISIKLFVGDNEAGNFVIGKNATDYLSTYISRDNDDKTYIFKKTNLYNVFNQSEWRDKTIFSSGKEKITNLRLQYSKNELVIEKSETGWQGTKPYKFPINEDKLAKIIYTMTDLQATNIPEQKFEGTGLEKASIIVQATGEGIDNTIMVGNNNGQDEYFAKRGDSDNIYLISKSSRDELEVTIKNLK